MVSQIVRGKSRAPEKNSKNAPQWVRHKPFAYHDSWEDHEILYTKMFAASEENAKAEAVRIDESMFNTYIMGMGKTDNYCVKEYKVILHDASDDIHYDIGGTIKAEDGQLWSERKSSVVSNMLLLNWRVITYSPSDASYKILEAKQRKT